MPQDHTLVPDGDIAAAIDAARPNIDIAADLSEALVIAHRSDVTIDTIDVERFFPTPGRSRGRLDAVTHQGFMEAVDMLSGPDTTIYTELTGPGLTAVINDDRPNQPGWRDHTVSWRPEPTPEWVYWIGGVGLHDQETFARIIDEGEDDIVDPSPTVMLDIAETFHASTTAQFKKSGRTQLAYEEEIEATAGAGMVELPPSFTIGARPFYGATPDRVDCRLRFRLNRGEFTIGYTINRPHEIVRNAFEWIVNDTIRPWADLTDRPVVEAQHPSPVYPRPS